MPDPRYQVFDTQSLGVSALRLDELAKSFHRNLLAQAKACLSQQPEMAVVLSQASAELCTEWAITKLLALRRVDDLAEPILDLFQVKDICNKRVRSIYTALSKDQPQQAPFWSELKRHHERRNSVVHRGQLCVPADAESSVSAVGLYIEHVESAVSRSQ